ncbi:transposase [Pseudogemmobacter sp. CC-YST710]|uniref:Transposase n=1 Tax=Pseudogemmobacter faecipullorum TaxID=2755041 RepID=A0ABS8CM81_9RHOB|nr:transposase [Pseudogemmobacter faecipullorum]
MDLCVGLDVSVRTTSICVMDGAGQVLKEAKVESEPSAIAALPGNFYGHYRRIGLEAGPLSQWLYSGLATAGYPVICVETRPMKAALSAQISKTDRNDTRDRPDDACRPVSAGPCQDRAQPGDPDAADGAEVPAIEDHRRREQPARVAVQFRPEGWCCHTRSIRGARHLPTPS